MISSDSDTKGHLYSFDTGSGELVWKVPFEYGVATSPLLIDGRVVVMSSAGDVAAIEAESGKIVWRVTPVGALNPSPFIPSPASAANRIFVADNINQILALDASGGATLWRNTLSGRTNASLVVIGEELIAGTDDGYLHRIDVKSGEVRKRTKLGGIPHGTPVRSDGLLLVLVSRNGKSRLVALDIAGHEVQWEQETRKEWSTYRPLVTGSVVVVGNEDKDLCAFDRATGERRWCRPIGEVPRGLAISQDGTLYVGSLSGVVQAFRIDVFEKR